MEAAWFTNQVMRQRIKKLWKLGLLPNTTFTIKKIEEKSVEVEMNGKVIRVPKQLAKQVNILS